jgi:excisionase family DNA binding protein
MNEWLAGNSRADLAEQPEQTDGTEWLSLKEASELLSVAPSTVRRWADCGRIPTHRTPGGHRRFDGAVVRAMVRATTTAHGVPASLWAVSARSLGQQPWHAHFAQPAMAEQMRGLGQRLLGLLIQYLVWHGDDSRFLSDGRAVGASYGQAARAAGVSMRETVQAFLYFRGAFWRMALQLPPVAQASDVPEIIRISERIDHFMNEVLLSTIGAYE